MEQNDFIKHYFSYSLLLHYHVKFMYDSAHLVGDEFPLKVSTPQNEQSIAGFTVLAVLPVRFI